MQISGATDLASKGQVVSDSSNVKVKAEVEDSFQIQSTTTTKIRCLCGSTLETGDLIKVKHSIFFFVLHGP
jgi:zinc finger MIZ domain-containing protein